MKINYVFFSRMSYFKVLLSLLRCHFFLLLLHVEERKGEDGDEGNSCRALAVRDTSWRNMSTP